MPRPLLTAGLLGVVAGLRSQLPAAALAMRGLEPGSGPLRLLGSGPGRQAAYLAAAGELVADKLPVTPSRVGAAQLAGRVLSGALAAATFASARGGGGRRLLLPALIGGLGAYAGSWAGYEARRRVVEATGVDDRVVAVGEDLVAVGLVALALPRDA